MFKIFKKSRGLALIKICSLSIGMAAILLVGLYIRTQSSFDQFHEQQEKVFRVGFDLFKNNQPDGKSSSFIAQFAVDAKDELPEIADYCRLSYIQSTLAQTENHHSFKIGNIRFADEGFFKLFSYELIQGDPNTALKAPYSIVISETAAKRIFGSEEVTGKRLTLNHNDQYQITGVIKDAPYASHLQYEVLASFSTLYTDERNVMNWNGGHQYETYLLLNKESDRVSLEKKLPDFMWKHLNNELNEIGYRQDATLQPLRDIHLYHQPSSENTRTNLYVLSVIAILILLIAGINYINLTTAQSNFRIKEIGVRKVLGASPKQLFKQIANESIATTVTAAAGAVIILFIFYPLYQNITGMPLTVEGSTLSFLLALLVSCIILTSLLGVYPVLYWLAVSAIDALKSSIPNWRGATFKKGLIVLQFSIATILITASFVVHKQLFFLKNTPTGIDKEKVLIVSLQEDMIKDKASLLKQELLSTPDLIAVGGISEVPYDGLTRNGFRAEGHPNPIMIHQLDADEQLLTVFGLELTSGEYFSKEKQTTQNGIIINETLAKQLGWNNAIGKNIKRDSNFPVIGVIKDFHFASLYNRIEPLIITHQPYEGKYDYLAIKYSGSATAAVNSLTDKWNSITEKAPLDYWFLDEAFNSLYKKESNFKTLLTAFTLAAILISIAGIWGIISITIGRKIKEIGIRKIVGASVSGITWLLSKEIIVLVLIASVISIPFIWWFMNEWLNDFAFRIELSWWMYILGCFSAILIAVVTICLQTLKAACANPIESIRNE